MVLGDAVTKLQRFVWLFNHVSRVITWSLFNLRAPNLVKWPILYGGVSLSISLNLKLAPVPYATPKWPIRPLDISTVKCNDSISFSFLFSFFFVKDQIASFQLKQIVVFLKCSACVF